MKKAKTFLCTLLVLILLCGCTPGADPGISGATEITQPAVTQPAVTKPTETQSVETQPQETQPPEYSYSIFCHKTGDVHGSADTSEMKDGALYAIENGKVWLVTEQVNIWHFTGKFIYYATKERPSEVIRTDRLGRGATRVYYGGEGAVIQLQYTDRLLLVRSQEMYGYAYHWIISVEFQSLERDVLMGAYRVEEFRRAPSSTEFPDIAAHISKEDWGETIWWKGKLKENDPETREYYYCVRTQEHWDAVTHQKVPGPEPFPFGYSTVYDGTVYNHWGDIDVSGCKLGALYYLDEYARKLHFVCEDPVIKHQTFSNIVFFVKAAEPDKIYAAPLYDLTRHTLVYQTHSGTINALCVPPLDIKNAALQITEDNKRLVWLDIATGSTEIILELYYMEIASVDDWRKNEEKPGESWQDYKRMYFVGNANEEDPIDDYWFYFETGEIDTVYNH